MTIDLNADVGEGAGDDAAVIPLVTSVNVSGGAHAGTPDTIARAIELAVEHGVTIGAHPGYPDREHFGRRPLTLEPAQLQAAIIEQLALLTGLAAAAGARLSYVKPHGALYHAVAIDQRAAAIVDRAIAAVDARLPVLAAPSAAHVAVAAARGARGFAEGFADRGYVAATIAGGGLTLAPRGSAGGVLAVHEAAEQARGLAVERRVIDLNGRLHVLHVDSLCLHGDHPNAPQLARRVRETLADAGVQLAPFASVQQRGDAR